MKQQGYWLECRDCINGWQRRSKSYTFSGVYLKISEPISLTGSAGGIPPKPPFRPPRQKAEAERTISKFYNPALRDCEAVPRLAANFL
jgi:hypothetical protein